MKRLLPVALLLSLAGCTTLQNVAADVFGGQVPAQAMADARKAYDLALVGWISVQLEIEHYGREPTCPTGQFIGCRSDVAWAFIKPLQHKVSSLIESTRPVVMAGTNDVNILLSVPSAVYDAQQALIAADPSIKPIVPPPPAPPATAPAPAPAPVIPAPAPAK